MKKAIINLLRCPFCGSAFSSPEHVSSKDGARYGILGCDCSEYPVIAGIPVIKKGRIGIKGQSLQYVTELVKAGRYEDALLCMTLAEPKPGSLAPKWLRSAPFSRATSKLANLVHRVALKSWREGATRFLSSTGPDTMACDLFDFYFKQAGQGNINAYDYFFYRFGQPRHLTALSFSTILGSPKKPILDLACGFGHMTHSLTNIFNGQDVIGADQEFFLLYVAKNWVAPDAEYICCAGDTTLPFLDDTFEATMCINSFHFFENKVICAQELKRITGNEGIIMLIALRHSSSETTTRNVALSLEAYQHLFSDMKNRIVADNDLVERYLNRQRPELSVQKPIEDLRKEPLVSLVASNRPDVFTESGYFEQWPHAFGALKINPLYSGQCNETANEVCLRRVFPSAHYEQENQFCKNYMPETISFDKHVLTDARRGERTPEIERLIENFVLLGIPERYYRSD